ncbi:hypothetical protein [Actinacidiphila yeochonensis]|uniref:hypothetical protein n=1 Tax=Actinacidiphila yeochonensis TaxID=89050 RepID=UPI00055CAED8|nr:hypothetical protein [Actinacidiphila yeochonensis]
MHHLLSRLLAALTRWAPTFGRQCRCGEGPPDRVVPVSAPATDSASVVPSGARAELPVWLRPMPVVRESTLPRRSRGEDVAYIRPYVVDSEGCRQSERRPRRRLLVTVHGVYLGVRVERRVEVAA